MPYTAEHKEETRRRIISSARRLFNRHGFTGVSIDQIMAAAGLTRGGFYNHFRTKDELYAEAVGQVLSCDMSQDWEGYELDLAAPPALLARQVIAAYVSDRHFSDVEASCPLMAVPSDVARGGTLVKEAYGKLLEAMVNLFEASQGQDMEARARAVRMAVLCIGGMVLSRAVGETAFGAEIREVARQAAFEAGGWDSEMPAAAE